MGKEDRRREKEGAPVPLMLGMSVAEKVATGSSCPEGNVRHCPDSQALVL